MPLTIIKGTLYSITSTIRYISPIDDAFAPDRYSGNLHFYKGNPSYVVAIDVDSKDSLLEEDICIYIGDIHNRKDIEDIIEQKKDLIYEICQSQKGTQFSIDLEKMAIIERKDFCRSLPLYGLHSLFVFGNINSDTYYCLVNNSKKYTDNELLSWLLSYICSGDCSLVPTSFANGFSKSFMHAMSQLMLFDGKFKEISALSNKSILDLPIADCGEVIVPIPDKNLTRVKELMQKAVYQMYPDRAKTGEVTK